jgi:hypothetical protein
VRLRRHRLAGVRDVLLQHLDTFGVLVCDDVDLPEVVLELLLLCEGSAFSEMAFANALPAPA